MVRIEKTAENSLDYSLHNTLRQALFLPTSEAAKYKAKAAIDTFFFRMGDVIAGLGVVFLLVRVLGLGTRAFAILNLGLAACWIVLAYRTGRIYDKLAAAAMRAGREPRTSRGLTSPVDRSRPATRHRVGRDGDRADRRRGLRRGQGRARRDLALELRDQDPADLHHHLGAGLDADHPDRRQADDPVRSGAADARPQSGVGGARGGRMVRPIASPAVHGDRDLLSPQHLGRRAGVGILVDHQRAVRRPGGEAPHRADRHGRDARRNYRRHDRGGHGGIPVCRRDPARARRAPARLCGDAPPACATPPLDHRARRGSRSAWSRDRRSSATSACSSCSARSRRASSTTCSRPTSWRPPLAADSCERWRSTTR